MEQVTSEFGNPTTLLIERIYWLGLGGFLAVAILSSLLKGLKQRKNFEATVSSKRLEDLAKKAIRKNIDINFD
tara:strand:- start:20 stop:238 length:219 start_codon:yes stop_codon:yes gene_type:complete